MDNLKEQGETDTKKGDESFTFRNGRVSKVSSGGIQKAVQSQLPLVNNSDEFPQEGSPGYSGNGKNIHLALTPTSPTYGRIADSLKKCEYVLEGYSGNYQETINP